MDFDLIFLKSTNVQLRNQYKGCIVREEQPPAKWTYNPASVKSAV